MLHEMRDAALASTDQAWTPAADVHGVSAFYLCLATPLAGSGHPIANSNDQSPIYHASLPLADSPGVERDYAHEHDRTS